jgi:DNA-binding transcriptional LysR family regulator
LAERASAAANSISLIESSQNPSSNSPIIAASLSFAAGGLSSGGAESGQSHSIAISGRISATNAEALRDATLAGYVIARLATFLISDDLRAGRLVPVLQRFDADGPPIRAVYPSSRHLSPKVRIFVDEVSEAWRPMPPWDVRNRGAA